MRRQKLGQHMFWKPRLPLVQVTCQQVHRQQPPPLQVRQDGQQGVAILAAGQAHQPALARAPANHRKVVQRLAHLPHQPLAQLLERHAVGRTPQQDRPAAGVNSLVNVVCKAHDQNRYQASMRLSTIRAATSRPDR
jgi:hypothetical protein